jgi:ankyrin repeat protein
MFKKIQFLALTAGLLTVLQPCIMGAMENNTDNSNFTDILIDNLSTNEISNHLNIAIKTDNMLLFNKLIKRYGTDSLNLDGWDALLDLAVEKNRLEMVTYLVEHINFTEEQLCFALYLAEECGLLPIVQYFAEKLSQLSIPAIEDDENLPLKHAIKGGNLEVVKYILGKYPVKSINGFINGSDAPALYYAIKYNHLPIVKFLREELGAKILYNNEENEQENEQEAAAAYGYLEILKYLVEQAGQISDKAKASVIAFAGQSGNLDILKYLLEGPWKDFKINTIGINDETPLTTALCRPLPLDIVIYFITKGASINARELLAAIEYQDLSILTYLVEKVKADLTVRCEDNNGTILHATMAFTKNNSPEDLERILVNACYLVSMKKIDIDAIDSNGNTPLHYIANSPVPQNNNISVTLKMTKLLVLNGAKIDMKNQAGETALAQAAKKFNQYSSGGNAGIVAYLAMVEDFDKVVKGSMTMQAFCKIYLDTPNNRNANFNDIKNLMLGRGSYKIFKQLITVDKTLAAASITGRDTSVKANQFGQDNWYMLLLRRAIEFRNLQFTLDLLTDKPQLFDFIDLAIKLDNKKINSSYPEEFMFQRALRSTDNTFKKQLANFVGQKHVLVDVKHSQGRLPLEIAANINAFITNQPLPVESSNDKKRKDELDELEKEDLKKMKK